MQAHSKLYPLIVAANLEETKRFYTEKAGFDVVTDMDHYLQLRAGKDESDPELAFMAAGTLPSGPNPGRFSGEGVIISIPTPSADEKAKAMTAVGVEILSETQDRPWGWRSFFVKDPNGVLLDFFHVLEEKPQHQNASG